MFSSQFWPVKPGAGGARAAQASPRGWPQGLRLAGPTTLSWGSDTFLAGPATPGSGWSCPSEACHRLGAAGIPTPRPAPPRL